MLSRVRMFVHTCKCAWYVCSPVVAVEGIGRVVLHHNIDNISQLHLQQVKALGGLQRHGADCIKHHHVAAVAHLHSTRQTLS